MKYNLVKIYGGNITRLINKFLIFASALLILPMVLNFGAKADAVVLENKTYEATYTIEGTSSMGKKMIAKNFEPMVMVERIDSLYYLSLTKKSSSIVGLTLIVDCKAVGNMLRGRDGENETYTFTLREESIFSDMKFQCYIKAMGMDQEFTITLDTASIKVILDYVEDIPNRPLEFGERPEFDKKFPMWGYMAIIGEVIAVAGIGLGVYFGYFRKKRKLNN